MPDDVKKITEVSENPLNNEEQPSETDYKTQNEKGKFFSKPNEREGKNISNPSNREGKTLSERISRNSNQQKSEGSSIKILQMVEVYPDAGTSTFDLIAAHNDETINYYVKNLESLIQTVKEMDFNNSLENNLSVEVKVGRGKIALNPENVNNIEFRIITIPVEV